MTLVVVGFMPYSFFPSLVIRMIEDDQMSFIYTADSVHIFKSLAQTVSNRDLLVKYPQKYHQNPIYYRYNYYICNKI